MKFELVNENYQTEGKKDCLEANASSLSKFFFWWTGDLVSRGYKKPLTENDLTDILEDEKLIPSYEKYLNIRKSHSRLSLAGAIHRSTRGTFLAILILTNMAYTLQFSGPILVGKIVGFITNRSTGTTDSDKLSDEYGITLGALLLSASLVRLFLQQHAMHYVNRYSMYINSILSGIIYQRVLCMPISSAHTTDSGKIINLMNVDTQNIYMFTQMMYWILICPSVIVASSMILYLQVGVYGLLGPILLLMGIFLQERLQRKTAEYKKKQMEFTDQRSKVLTEYLNNMKTIKFNCWEGFLDRTNKNIRKMEISYVYKGALVLGFVEVLAAIIPLMIIVIIFSIHIFLENELNAEKAFTVLGLFSMIFLPLKQSAIAGLRYSSAKVSLQRIADFEKGLSFQGRNPLQSLSKKVIQLQEASYSWKTSAVHEGESRFFSLDDNHEKKSSKEGKARLLCKEEKNNVVLELVINSNERIKNEENMENCVLRNLTLSVQPGEFIGITGPTGAGKSSLLQAILQELHYIEGKSLVSAEKISYSSQSIFLFNDTIKSNILFFNEYEENRYEEVLRVCDLNEDFEAFPNRDLTNIGDAGTKLSMGQRQRIALARCIYAKAELYLLDNCLSSIDSRVAKRILKNLRVFLQNRTVLLVTQISELIQIIPRVLTIENGTIVDDQLQVNNFEENEDKVVSLQSSGQKIKISQKAEKSSAPAILKGAIPSKIYWDYFCSSGTLPLVFVSFIFALSQGARFVSDWWLGVWSTKKYDYGIKNNLLLYVFLAFFSGLALFVRSAVFFKVSLHFSQKVNSKIMETLLKTKLQWFDSTPVGQILARLVKDQDNLDNMLPSTILFNLTQVSMLITVFITGGLASVWYILIVLIVAVIYTSMVKYYIRAARESKRIELESKAPIITILNETVTGLSVIRAFDCRHKFLEKFRERCDSLTIAMQNNLFCGRWIAFRSELFGTILISASSFLAIIGEINNQHADQIIIGLALSFSLQINVLLACLIRSLATIETQMTSAQRIFNIIQNNPLEENENVISPENKNTPLDIEFFNCSFQHNPQTSIVLRNINLTIKKGEKVAIVGRTGSGKSTLLLGLVGLLKREDINGSKLRIAGLDVNNWSSKKLRDFIGIVPQDSVLITGTIKSNIDPEGLYTDLEIVSVLKKLGWLIDMPLGINTLVVDGGKGFSAGQKQIINLARAIIKRKEILLIDEGTSCLEENTSENILKLLHEDLVDQTLVFVTHRPADVSFFKKVVFIHKGVISKIGSPQEIIEEMSRVNNMESL